LQYRIYRNFRHRFGQSKDFELMIGLFKLVFFTMMAGLASGEVQSSQTEDWPEEFIWDGSLPDSSLEIKCAVTYPDEPWKATVNISWPFELTADQPMAIYRRYSRRRPQRVAIIEKNKRNFTEITDTGKAFFLSYFAVQRGSSGILKMGKPCFYNNPTDLVLNPEKKFSISTRTFGRAFIARNSRLILNEPIAYFNLIVLDLLDVDDVSLENFDRFSPLPERDSPQAYFGTVQTMSIFASRAKGKLTVWSYGVKGTRPNDPRSNAPGVILKIEKESDLKFQINQVPGPGGKNGRVCVQIGGKVVKENSPGDCAYYFPP
jgi:hypothetical protein